jgi:hypothetical protein
MAVPMRPSQKSSKRGHWPQRFCLNFRCCAMAVASGVDRRYLHSPPAPSSPLILCARLFHVHTNMHRVYVMHVCMLHVCNACRVCVYACIYYSPSPLHQGATMKQPDLASSYYQEFLVSLPPVADISGAAWMWPAANLGKHPAKDLVKDAKALRSQIDTEFELLTSAGMTQLASGIQSILCIYFVYDGFHMPYCTHDT